MGILSGLAPRQSSAPPAQQAPTGPLERFGAGFRRETILTNAWNYRNRVRERLLSEQAEQAFGDPDVWKQDTPYSSINTPGMERYFAQIREAARIDPSRFGDMIKSRDALERAVEVEMKRELDEMNRILRAAPGDAFAVETLGAMSRAATDEAGVAAGFLGLGIGSVARMGILGVMATEAGLGAASEAAILPQMREQADRLGVEQPDAALQILLGAAGGMLFPAAAGILRGGGRVAARARGSLDRFQQARSERATTGGADEATHDSGVAKAGQAVTRDDPDALPDHTDLMPDESFRPSRDSRGINALGQDFDRVVDALIKNESSGDPSALGPVIQSGSNAGDQAIGLAQVMPNTAREIARELGDSRFPHDGSNADITAYLRDPEINRRYGEHYLRKQLRRYDGDLEAALIAYNAGPGNADKWLAAGRDYSALPQPEQTQPYVQRIFADLAIDSEAGGQGFSTAPRGFRAAELEVDPERFQFKDADATGRTGALRGATYDEESAGLLTVFERRDGRRTVVDGHERLGLAREAGPDTRVNAIVLREADGWTETGILARTGILDFFNSQADPEQAARALNRQAAAAQARAERPDLFERVEAAEQRLNDLQAGLDPAQAVRLRERLGPEALDLAERDRLADDLGVERETLGEIQATRQELDELQAERATLVRDTEPSARVRPEDATQAIEAGTEPEVAEIFGRTADRGIPATVKEVAAHVRGRVPAGDAGRPDALPRRQGAQDEDGLSEVAQERLAQFDDPADETINAEIADEGLREVERHLAEGGDDLPISFNEDGEATLTARQVINETQAEREFIEALELCPTGRTT